MLKSLFEKINSKKQQNYPYYTDVIEIETAIPMLSIYDQIQAFSFLQCEYFIADDFKKCLSYIDLAKSALSSCLVKNILDNDDFIHFGSLLCDIIINEIKIKNEYLLLDDCRTSELYGLLKHNCFKLFVFIIEMYRKEKNLHLLFLSLDYVTCEDAWKVLFEEFLNIDNNDLGNRICKITTCQDVKPYYLLFMGYDKEYNDIVMKNIIDSKNNYENLQIVVSNALKSGKHDIFIRLIDELQKITEAKNSSLNFYILLAEKLRDKNKHIQDICKDNEVIMNDYIEFLLSKKEYARIVELDVTEGLRFYCLVKLNRIDDAKIIYTKYIYDKYNIDCTENKQSQICQKALITYLMKTNEITPLLNIIQDITQPMLFVKVLKKAYKYKLFKILKEGINIGINKFGSQNHSLIKVFISFLHIQELDIQIDRRISMLLLIVNQVSCQDLFLNDRVWLYNVVYNNCIDAIETKDLSTWKLIEILLKIEDYNLEIVHLILMSKKRNITPESDTHTLIELLNIYTKFPKRDINISILFYELVQDNRVIDLFKPFLKLGNPVIQKLLCVSNQFFNMKIELYRIAEGRGILTDEVLNRFASGIAIYGTSVLIEVFESVNIKSRMTKHIESIIMQQIEYLKLTNNKVLKIRLIKLLEE